MPIFRGNILTENNQRKEVVYVSPRGHFLSFRLFFGRFPVRSAHPSPPGRDN